MRVLIDGMDLSGKSTLAQGLTEALNRLGIPARRNVGGLHAGRATAMAQAAYRARPPGDGAVAWAFFASALSDAIFGPASPGEVLVQEAYTDHSVAFAEAFGHRGVSLALRALRPALPRFDLIVYLGASLETRRRRYQSRPKNDAVDAMLLTDPERFQAIDDRLRALLTRRGALIIETDGLCASEVLAATLSRVLTALARATADPVPPTRGRAPEGRAAQTRGAGVRPRRRPTRTLGRGPARVGDLRGG